MEVPAAAQAGAVVGGEDLRQRHVSLRLPLSLHHGFPLKLTHTHTAADLKLVHRFVNFVMSQFCLLWELEQAAEPL